MYIKTTLDGIIERIKKVIEKDGFPPLGYNRKVFYLPTEDDIDITSNIEDKTYVTYNIPAIWLCDIVSPKYSTAYKGNMKKRTKDYLNDLRDIILSNILYAIDEGYLDKNAIEY